ncbi:thioesterase family protein [Desulfohalobium retbaense]|uniref:Thioesterase-like protein n=1 Tax=Desulfohalobium retbaense (strain ATCC 49708 / DSM 5692 / JCM 16813 / HR100) TaxID=485915 RepID=C8X023_DESRD|nr:thioesterase family protein [Desulfohalobium retbaense]ACV67648.1 conserved hypothetical protein [Desulfohalobium retbaense DSM 5692]
MPLVHNSRVQPEWIDYNGHMSEAFYVLIFGHATDAFLDAIGLDAETRSQAKVSAYTVEAHIRYVREVQEGEAVEVQTQLVGHDAKRAHLFHTMARAADGTVVATEEILVLHVDTQAGGTAPFQPVAANALEQLQKRHDRLPRPQDVARAITMPSRSVTG